MTDNDIIKVGECIRGEKVLCLSCPYRVRFPNCRKYAIRDIFDLAARQKAEIERLKSPSEMQIEVSEKLENTIKAEAIKEFAERLKDGETYEITYCGSVYNVVDIDTIDNLVKEMVGDENV